MRFCPRCGTRFLAGEPYCPHDGSPTQDLPDEVQIDTLLGTVVDGRYRIEKRIGEGGMGIVYLATHTVLGKRLGLKVLRGEMARDPDVVQRFITEAQSATSIGHENIIDISDFGRLPDGTVYFVMEYLDGEALTDMIKRGGSVPVRDAVHIIRQISGALGAAHSRGIVHRDLKPDNIYLVKRGDGSGNFVKVLDFGIAKVGGASSKLTKTGMVFGTPHYMSPEQAAGQTVDQRTDIYALGVIMYEMFVGKVPFDADTFMGILTKHMFETPVPPSQTQQGAGNRLGALEDMTLKALQKKPEHRYQTMAELVVDLDRVAQGGQIAVGMRSGIVPPDNLADALEPPSRTEMRMSAPSAPDNLVTGPKRAPLFAIGAVLLVLVGLVIGGVVLALTKGDDAEALALRTAEQRAAAETAGAAAAAERLGAQIRATALLDAGVGTSTASGNVGTPPSGVAGDLARSDPASGIPLNGGTGTSAAPTRNVTLASTPPGAEVYQGGALVGNTPIELSKPTGTTQLTLEVRSAGFRAQNVLVSAMSPAALTVALVRVSGGGGRPRLPDAPNPNPTPSPNPTPNTGAGNAIVNELANPWGNN